MSPDRLCSHSRQRQDSRDGQEAKSNEYAQLSGVEEEFVNRCERVIREEAKSPLSDGRATLRRVESEIGPWFELMPASERACPLSLTPNGPGDGELSIGVGRHDSWFERWGSADETVEFLRKALEAVIAGRYEEFIKGRKAVGRLELRDGPYLFRQNTIFARWPPKLGPWTRETYEPY